MALGEKTGGRQKGTPNKKTKYLETLAKAGCDPVEILAKFALNDVPCSQCEPESPNDDCKECKGTGKNHIDNEHRLRAATRLVDSLEPKLANKQVEISQRKVMLVRMNTLNDDDKSEFDSIVEEETAEEVSED